MSDFALLAARLNGLDDDLAALADRVARVEALLGPWLADQAAALDPRNHPQTREDAPRSRQRGNRRRSRARGVPAAIAYADQKAREQ